MNKFIVVDFETTGNKSKNGDRIIQIGAVLIENGEIVSQLSTLVNPGVSIPPFIQQLTKINDDMVKDAPTIDVAIVDLLPLLDGAVFVAHNVHFDLGFLQNSLADCGYMPFTGPILDTVELSRLLLPGQIGYKLSELSSDLDVEHEFPHQADSDALATARIFLTLLEKLNSLPLLTIQRLVNLTKNFSSDISLLISRIEQKRIIEGRLDEEVEGLEMYRQLAVKRKGSVQKIEHDAESDPFHSDLPHLYEKMSQEMPGFELRTGQQEMMKQIYQAFCDSQHMLIEAGTGTGKSLAYLVPALYWAHETGEKVVISTHTIQLQEQLFSRDLPFLANLLSIPFSAAIFKGRNNYLCLRKFEFSLLELSDNYDVQLTKGQILTWLTETETGDVEEVNMPSGGHIYWRQVQSDANSCLNHQCPWFSRCYYYSARRKAGEADLIVTNHSLLFTDMKAEQRILPTYNYAIVDEAHQFEDVASHHLGMSVSSVQMESLWNELGSEKGTGILDRLEQECGSQPLWEGIQAEYRTSQEILTDLKEYSKELFHQLFSWGKRFANEGMEVGRLVKRYRPGEWTSAVKVIRSADFVKEWMSLLQTSLEKMYITLHEEKESSLTVRSFAIDLHGAIKDIQKLKELFQCLILQPEEGNVYWMELETRTTRKKVVLQMVPIDIAPVLREDFFTLKKSVVLTSATLSVDQSFDYSLQRLGLNQLDVESVHHQSPFDYRKQTFFCVPTDIPALKHGDDKLFMDVLVKSLCDLAVVTDGRMMILFTSYGMLRQVYEAMKANLSHQGFTVLGHGIDSSSRTKLTKQFKQTEKCILLGTSSFWEGVDIPGEALSCLAIVRLPFWPPNHPMVEARNEQIKERKGNPFMELSVPQAVIRFKQGFGRLVRTQRDKGVVIVFDKRMIESRYGKYFIRSLPDTPVHNRPMQELLPMISEWLG